MVKKKRYPKGTDKGSRCSGWGVYPGGRRCKGCSDCKSDKGISDTKKSNKS